MTSRRDELEMLRAVEGLAASEREELDSILAAAGQADSDAFDHAAAALDLAMRGAEDGEAIPPAVEARVLAGAAEWFRRRDAQTAAPADLPPLDTRTVRRDEHQPWAPWLLAAAAALVAVVGWWPRAAVEPPGEPAPSIAELTTAPDALVRPLAPGADPTGAAAAGEVVWSASRQAGFLRLRGLAANDPRVEQYQLWIFDRTRDERYPIDGGVFDIAPGAAEAVVAIDAGLPVTEPYLFAVTVEKPGGVVVSSRERIALLAEV